MAPPRPIFVVGCPRSGTTVTGALIGTFPQVANLGEYAAFYFTRVIAEKEYRGVPTPCKADWLEALSKLAFEFAESTARQAQKRFFLDSTPWNTRIIANLAEEFSDAVFVLVLRHYRGVVQSLARSYCQGWRWCGRTLEERAALWAEMYGHCEELPTDRTVALGFDQLCEAPQQTLRTFLAALETKGVSSQGHELAVLAQSHATVAARETIAHLNGDGRIVLQRRSSFDPKDWPEDYEARIDRIVREVDEMLARRFPQHYIAPRVSSG